MQVLYRDLAKLLFTHLQNPDPDKAATVLVHMLQVTVKTSLGLFFSPLSNWVSYCKVMTCKMCCFWLSECMTEEQVLPTVPFEW